MEINGDAANVDDLTTLTLYNYGNFTSMEVDGLRVKGLSLHLDRLSKDSTVIHGTGVSRDRVRELIKRSTGPNERHIVRVSILSRVFDLGHPSKPLVPDILISSRPAPAAALAPVTLRTHHFERHLPLVKHVGLLGSLYLRRAVQLDGYDDVLFTDRSGAISEGATWNIGLVKGGTVVWPSAPCLPGVTMRLLTMSIANSKLQQCVDTISSKELSSFDAAFLTNAAVGVRPISTVDELRFNIDSSVVQSIAAMYHAIEGEYL